MSQQIKFRVWDEYFKQWAEKYSSVINSSLNINEIFIRQKYIFQQFTGKKDVNGSEIYEGDILEYSEGVELGDFIKRKGVAVYDEISCAFGIASNATSDPINYFWEGTVNGFKVVGNIFEGEKIIL
jgi:hypothetical protein